ncbi:phage portal protein [Kribbella sp. CA-293567]|uniref:phage portal protein n=1 Tax=Kribbella sp. CA-293567 TaxID=3002436 RepID=UPI0022DE5B4C|nr:phage portal protein [Kribbella sp. CA-293567]WBQ03779.1 phage portal protein [Kribbella sp. CA-293567]
MATLDRPAKVAESMISDLRNANEPGRGHLGKTRRYLKGHHDLPYMPRGAKAEYREMAKRSITNWLPLISDTFAKVLFVEGYRAAKQKDNDSAWKHWQANKLDARQSIAHRGALEYGVSYVLVLPSDSASPLIKPLHPTRVWAEYEDDDDEYPQRALIRKGKDVDGSVIFELYDETYVYTILHPQSSSPVIVDQEAHGMPAVPLVRFRDRLDGENVGIIAPLLPIQDRINEAVFALMIALQYASFRQRWATGLVIPTGEDGKPVEPFQAAIDRLWVTDNPEAKFGDFAQTEVSGHINTYEMTVRTLAAIAQTSPHVLVGDLINLSADAMAAAEATTQRKAEEYEVLFGESWEQVLALAAIAAGEEVPSVDARVRWRDSEARSMAQTVDALGKMVTLLGVPAEGAWSRVPGVTDTELAEWHRMKAAAQDGTAALAAAIDRQTQSTITPPDSPPEPAQAA